VIHILAIQNFTDSHVYISAEPPHVHLEAKESEIHPLLDEKYLFVGVTHLSGASAWDSILRKKP
jgi:hypothetical protein